VHPHRPRDVAHLTSKPLERVGEHCRIVANALGSRTITLAGFFELPRGDVHADE